MVQEGLQNQEGSGSQSYDFEEKISKEKIDRIQESEEEVLMAKYQGPKMKIGEMKRTNKPVLSFFSPGKTPLSATKGAKTDKQFWKAITGRPSYRKGK